MLRTREGRYLLAVYAAVAVVCASLPLADHLGFEFAAVLTVACALASPFVGFAAMRMERSVEPDRRRPAGAALHAGLFAVGGLALPTLLILLNGVRRPLCDPVSGFVWLLILAAPTAWLGATLGALAGLVTSRRRRAIGIVALVEGASIVTSLAVAYVGPSVFVFDHVFGYFPGPLYDETIPISAALLSFRATTVLWGVAALAGAGALASGDRASRRMHRAWAFALSAALIVTSLVWGSDLAWRTTDRSLRAALPGEIHIDGLVLHFSRNLPDRDIERLVRDATFDAAEVARSLGITPRHPIHVWMYRDGAQKRRLVGAEGSQFAKPYRHEIHIDPRGYPHGSLQHELVHAMAGEFARGPWRTPGGLIPNSVLVEGFAVAFDLDDGILTPTQEAKAMRDLKLAPRLERLLDRGGFASESSTRAYTYSGAFIRYLASRFGIEAMRNLYLTGDLAMLGPPQQLVRDFERMLDTVRSTPDARSSAARRNARPGILGRRCAREVAAIVDSANALADNRLWDRSLAKLDQACALEPSDPALIQNKLGVAIRARPSDLSRIMTIAEELWAHPRLDPSLEAASRTLVGDELWRLGDPAGAHAQFARAAALPLGPPTRRAAMIRLRAITDTALAALLKPYYADKDVGLAQVFRLSDALERRPNDAVLSYMVGRELVLRGADDKGAMLLERADAIGLGDPTLALDNLRNLVVARANRNLCGDAERGRVRLRAAGGSSTDDAVAANRVARCRFAVARGWLPLL